MSALQLFDALPTHIEDALRASIRRFGVIVPVVKDQHGRILDGHHRSRIAEELGVDFTVQAVTVANEDEAREIARTLNSDRRQLTEEQRRAVVVELRQLGHSERAIAGAVGVSKTTVHNDLEAARLVTGDQSEPHRIVRQGGGSYPARRPGVADPEPGPAATADPPLPFDETEPQTLSLPDTVDCKYCHQTCAPEIGPDGSLIVCNLCGAGLATLEFVIEAGGWDAYQDHIHAQFAEASLAARSPSPIPFTGKVMPIDAEFRAAVRESAERQQQEVLELLAKQEAVNAFSRASDGLLSAVSYAAAFRPPAEITAERINQFIARTERLLETARTWKEQHS